MKSASPEYQNQNQTRKETNEDTGLTSFRKINSSWIVDLNIKFNTIKLEDFKGENLDDWVG